MALSAFRTFGVTIVAPPLRGAACTTWSHALWQGQGTGSGSARAVPAQRGFCSHSLTHVSQPCSALHASAVLLPDISAMACASFLAATGRRRGDHHAPEQPLLGHLCPAGPRCTLQSSGLGHIQHRALQPAGSLTAPAGCSSLRHPKHYFRSGLRPSTPLALAPT